MPGGRGPSSSGLQGVDEADHLTDTSDYTIGGVLCQEDEDNLALAFMGTDETAHLTDTSDYTI